MNKTHLFVMLFLLFVFLPYGSTVAETQEPLVVVGEQGSTYLFSVSDKTYLAGNPDITALQAQYPDVQVDFVVLVCDHPEHVAAAEALAIPVIRPSEAHDGLTWQEGALLLGDYAFSVNEPVPDILTLDCKGEFLAFQASANTSSVNVRATPTAKGKRVEKLSKGTVVTVAGREENDAGEIWFRVILKNGEEGYVRADLLDTGEVVAATPVPESNEADNRYVGNKNSKVFHRPGCEHLPKGKNAVYFSSRSYAIAKGYRPCEHCAP